MARNNKRSRRESKASRSAWRERRETAFERGNKDRLFDTVTRSYIGDLAMNGRSWAKADPNVTLRNVPAELRELHEDRPIPNPVIRIAKGRGFKKGRVR
jgi:hypothetical protein